MPHKPAPISVAAFCEQHRACDTGRFWALAQPEQTMRALWLRPDLNPRWRIWIATRPGAMCDRDLRLFACWCATCTPLGGGRVSGALLTDPRSREAVRVAVRFALGRVTLEQLAQARHAAYAAAAAAYAAYAAAHAAAADAAACAAYAAHAAAHAAAAHAAAHAAAACAAYAAYAAARQAQAARLLTLLPVFPL